MLLKMLNAVFCTNLIQVTGTEFVGETPTRQSGNPDINDS